MLAVVTVAQVMHSPGLQVIHGRQWRLNIAVVIEDSMYDYGVRLDACVCHRTRRKTQVHRTEDILVDNFLVNIYLQHQGETPADRHETTVQGKGDGTGTIYAAHTACYPVAQVSAGVYLPDHHLSAFINRRKQLAIGREL